jgi:hypothetical protein
MCESPQHPNGPWYCARRSPQRSTHRTDRGLAKFLRIPNDVRSLGTRTGETFMSDRAGTSSSSDQGTGRC